MYLNAISFYRVSKKFNDLGITPLSRFFDILGYLIFNSNVHSAAKIGKGTFCSHRGMSVVVHREAVIGNDCTIGTSVVIGGGGKDKPGAPVIGDRVFIATGAKIIGKVNIGDDVTIGANSVVNKDVPSGCTAVGVPARIVSR